MQKQQSLIGEGSTKLVYGLPIHNPPPSTPRGEKRHANRNDSAKARAEAAWKQDRSIKKSKKQLQFESNGAKNKGR